VAGSRPGLQDRAGLGGGGGGALAEAFSGGAEDSSWLWPVGVHVTLFGYRLWLVIVQVTLSVGLS